jgi:hypothetical protein
LPLPGTQLAAFGAEPDISGSGFGFQSQNLARGPPIRGQASDGATLSLSRVSAGLPVVEQLPPPSYQLPLDSALAGAQGNSDESDEGDEGDGDDSRPGLPSDNEINTSDEEGAEGPEQFLLSTTKALLDNEPFVNNSDEGTVL